MPAVSTDDAARRQEFIWLGPVNSPWPFEARGRAWVMAVLLCPALVVVAGAMASPLVGLIVPGPAGVLFTALVALSVGVGAGIGITRAVGRLISPTRPLGHHVAVLGMEIAAPREAGPRTHRLSPCEAAWIEDAPANRRTRRLLVPAFTDMAAQTSTDGSTDETTDRVDSAGNGGSRSEGEQT